MKTVNAVGVSALAAVLLAGTGLANALGGDAAGSAQVRVEMEPPGGGVVVFDGVPGGTIGHGGTLAAEGLAPGSYTTTATGPVPGYLLTAIECDDGGSPTLSRGRVPTSSAEFGIDPGETVSCLFRYRASEMAPGQSAQPGAGQSTPPAPAGPAQPAEPGDPVIGSSEDCEAPQMVPRAGVWNVSNQLGRMVCGAMINMPLQPSQEPGTLEIRDCGWTVVGTGMAEDTAPLTMRAVDGTSGRYTGTVGGAQDGIPMTIDFNWKLNSEEWIVGDLKSVVTQQGMTCTMTRPFELRYRGG